MLFDLYSLVMACLPPSPRTEWSPVVPPREEAPKIHGVLLLALKSVCSIKSFLSHLTAGMTLANVLNSS